MLVVAIAFVLNVKVRKPGKIGLLILILIGLVEFIACIISFSTYTI
jgi:CDP-diacylglycerol--serine O-phosphatidyltransferase